MLGQEPAPDPIPRLKHQDPSTRFGQRPGGRETGYTGSQDEAVVNI